MRHWLGILGAAALAAGVGGTVTGCGSSTRAPGTDAGSKLLTGGAIGAGGLLGSGGTTGMGGATGSGLVGTGGGTGGLSAGGAGGIPLGGSGGTTAKDASTDGAQDAPGIDGNQTVVYRGCGFGNLATLSRFDKQAGTCVTLVLDSLEGAADAGFDMTVSQNWSVTAICLYPASLLLVCGTYTCRGLEASSASGNVTVNSSSTIDIDAVAKFPSSDAGPVQSIEMKASAVYYGNPC